MTREQTRHSKAWYNTLSRYYDTLIDPFQGPLRRRGIDSLRVAPDDHVLAVGCGTGREIATLQNAVESRGRVVGIDVAEQMCHLAQDRLDEADAFAVICGDALALPFDSDRFDVVLVSFTLELFEADHRATVLEEIRRVLEPGGRICVISPSATASSIISPLYTRLNEAFPRLVDSRPFDVSAVLAEAGFEILQTQVEWALVVPVELVVARWES
ncbi:class I SAM-dependent methyltransferase [Halostagnicola kamekurae]|uniref:Demethylmenaquinone methyltransferase / 2-methoxy-6-polyprenyl-1,4-benzoquinol methylase n=1 Tax=Halostagnicola kamekurae TaxID=619731 RepID=A0A1I6UE39_9EURY|nr:methyltransferase domain-containing protein [Halostagnicola kamekurae]SFS99567.1 demethylmenaquinone methyltransferase / 2-methoxy-6-polyprenyl-1,4-benzoquinol methylase [Halostagnicola kamekurae]